MKKHIATTLAVIMAVSALAPLASADEILLTEANEAQTEVSVISEKKEGYTVTVNGKELDVEVKENEKGILLPVRAIAEELGFTVTWNEDEKSVRVDTGIVNINFAIGKNLYVRSSSVAIGMAAPQELSCAPELINDKTYIPAEVFTMLFGNRYKALTVFENTVIINYKEEVPEETMDIDKLRDEFGIPVDFDSQEGSTESPMLDGVPSPMAEYESLEELCEAVGFEFVLPKIPEGYEADKFLSILKTVADVRFVSGENTITYRVSKETGDISGDYTVYEKEETIEINEIEVTIKGDAEKIMTAAWENNGFSYSIHSTEGFTMDEIENIIK